MDDRFEKDSTVFKRLELSPASVGTHETEVQDAWGSTPYEYFRKKFCFGRQNEEEVQALRRRFGPAYDQAEKDWRD